MSGILIATDAWRPQINGVVLSLERMSAAARELGAEISFLTPKGFAALPLPGYSEIKLAFPMPGEIARRVESAAPDHIHIATEGPVGLLTRNYCCKRALAFTSGYHTRFPEYISSRLPIPEAWSYAALRRFHAPSHAVMTPTASMRDILVRRGFANVRIWSRGVDHLLYRPRATPTLDLPHPIFLNVGRVAVEKNLAAFLDSDLPGSKVVVGDGPALASLKARFPLAHFLGAKQGDELAAIFASADVFVFPSRTDTFGIVLIEALASGLPVAGYPVPGPLDIIGTSKAGVLSEDLRSACLAALSIPREVARAQSLQFTWKRSAQQFLGHIEDCRRRAPRATNKPTASFAG